MGERLRKKIADCRELYMWCGGAEHDLIEAGMHERGWAGFSKRSLYARTKQGKRTPGWPERFGWDEEVLTAETLRRRDNRAQDRSVRPGTSRRLRVSAVKKGSRGKSGVAYANRRTFARERSDLARPAALNAPAEPRSNRQKMRRDRKLSTPHSALRIPHSPDPFHAWLKTMPGAWHWDWRHQVYLYRYLQKVTDGECKRLMIFMPPRHGKSELVTVRYAAWRLKQDPSMNIILGSYNQQLANNFSRKIRNVLCDDAAAEAAGEGEWEQGSEGEGKNRRAGEGEMKSRDASPSPQRPFSPTSQSPFPFTRQRPKNSEAEWGTSVGGGLKAVGVGAGVTGYGANLIIIDDPVKSRAEAESKRYRDKLWHWFNDDLYTRLEPDGAIILIQTRWHEDDLAGRLLNEMADGGRCWEVVNLPALAEVIENGEITIENGEITIENGELRIENEEPRASDNSQLPTFNSELASSDNSQFSILN